MATFDETMSFLTSKRGQEALELLKQRQERRKKDKGGVPAKKRYQPITNTEKKGDDFE